MKLFTTILSAIVGWVWIITPLAWSQVENAWHQNGQTILQVDTQAKTTPIEHRSTKYSSIVKLRNLPPQDSPDIAIATATNITQSENSVFVHPGNFNLLLNSNNSSNYPVSTIYGASRYISTDGGLTWTGSEQGAGGTNSGDPAACIGLNGHMYIGYIAANSGNGMARSTDNGLTWTHYQVAPNPGSLADKNHLWIDNSPTSPYSGYLYAAFTDFGGSNNQKVVFYRSTNGGVNWSSVLNISAGTASYLDQGVNIQTGPNGDVYCAWAVYDASPSAGNPEKAIGFAKSTDGGATFLPATRIITNISGIRAATGVNGLGGGKDMRVNSFPSMTVDKNGHIYIVWANEGVPGVNGGDPDVYLIKSTDLGSTWGTPIRVNQDAMGNAKDQWFPWIASDPVSGSLAVIFYDSRDFSGNDQANTYVAVSRDGGATWEDFRVSDVSWSGDGSGTGFSSNYAGDYISIAFHTGRLYPVWTDRREAGNRLNTFISPILVGDPSDPNPVGNITAYSDYLTPTSMSLEWTDPTTLLNGDPIDTFVVDVYLEGILKGTVPKGTQAFTGTGLTTYTQYSYELYVRTVPNDSLSSAASSAFWYAGGHPVPKRPTNIAVTGGPVSGTITWTNPTEMMDGTPIHDQQYVYIYRNGTLVDSVSQGSPTTQYIDTPPDGDFYTYHVAMKLSTGYVSALSDEATAYIGPAADIVVTPDTLFFSTVTNGLDSAYYYIHNTGQDTLVISGIEDEEVNPTAAFRPAFTQEQKFTPDYPKGAMEPVYGDVTDGQGGPDPFGYRWIDSDEPGGPIFNWFDISTIGTLVTGWVGSTGSANDDDGYVRRALPFTFPFYGSPTDSLRIVTNGFLSLDMTSTATTLTNAAIPAVAQPNKSIYPFWDDLDLDPLLGGAVYTYHDAVNNRFIVQYDSVPHYGTTTLGRYTYQVIMYPSGKIVCQYLTMLQTVNSATIGIENADGTMGLQVVYNAAYMHDNLAIQFSRGVQWLDHTPTVGIVVPGDSLPIKANINAAGLVGGTYHARAMIDNNVPLLGPYPHPIFKMTVTGVPDIGVDPVALNYGQVFLNYPDTLSFRINNTGTDLIHVTNITTATAYYEVLGATSFDIPVGGHQDVPVVFEAAVSGMYYDTVTVLSNAFSGTKIVALVAEAVSVPSISVSPDSFAYVLPIGDSVMATTTVYNTGDGPLNYTTAVEGGFAGQNSDDIGNTENNLTTTSNLMRGGVVGVTTTVQLLEIKSYLNISTSRELRFVVYENTTQTGTFTKIFESTLASSGTGTRFYSSGPVNITLHAGKYYAVGVDWNGGLNYFWDASAPVPIPISFGTITGGLAQSVFPPPATITQNALTSLYYTQLVTALDRWLTVESGGTGTVASGDSAQLGFKVSTTALLAGAHDAALLINNNDPANPTVRVPIHVETAGIPDIDLQPDTLDFGTEFVGVSDTLNVRVVNTGSGTLHVTDIEVNLSAFTVLGSTSFDVLYAQYRDVPIVFHSTDTGTYWDTVTVTSDAVSGLATAFLSGQTVAPPIIAVSDTLINGGVIGAGEEDSTTFMIYNHGYSNLTYSIAEGEDMFTALGFGQPNTSRVRINPLKPVLNQVKRSAGSEDGVTSTASAEVTGDLRTPTASTMAQFDLQFAYDATAVTGAAGNAAAVYANGEFWTSRWASNILHRWNPDGTLIEQFTVTGVTGTRGLTWDGQYLYAGINTATIQVIDQASKTLVGTIATSGAGNVRFIAYDPVRDGFWVGNFTGNIFCVNRSGSVIATITTSLAGKYGAAYDGFSEGGPYLWVWDQGGGDGTPQLVYQFNLNTLTATGLQFDVASISAIGPGIAGGLFITDELVPGKATLGGMLQGGVGNTDKLWGLELASSGLVWLDVSPSEGTIAAGDSAETTIYFHGILPTEVMVDGYLGIASNDPVTPMTNVHVLIDVSPDDIADQNAFMPTRYALHTNYPNPFNPTTTIKYDLKEAGAVSLKVYNILGQEVRTLVNARETAGFKVATWDGRNNAGQTVASGIYIYRLETEKFTKSRKMMLLK